MRKTLMASTALLIAAAPGLVMAQAAPIALDEVVITAQRQEETQQRAAIAVDVLQSDDVISAGITQVDRLGQLAPSLSVQSGGTGSIFFVRGVGNFTVSPNSDPAVAFSYDDVYVG